MKKLTKAEWEKVIAAREAEKARADEIKEARRYLRSLDDKRTLAAATSFKRRDAYDEHRHTCKNCDDEDLCSTGRRIFNTWFFARA